MGNVELSRTTSVKRIQEGPISDLQNSQGKALADIFNKDTLKMPVEMGTDEVQTPSFWRKLINQLFSPAVKETPQIVAPHFEPTEPINRVPVLPEPDEIETAPASSMKIEEIALAPEQKQKVAEIVEKADEVVQALQNHPSDHPAVIETASQIVGKVNQLNVEDGVPIEHIMNEVLKLMIARQEEGGIVSSELYKKFNEMARFSRDLYQQLEDKSKKDEKIASGLGYTQMGLGLAVFMTTIICATAFFFPPAAALLPVSMSTVQAIGGFLGLGTALAKGGEAYFKGRQNQNSAEALERDNKRTIMKDASSIASDSMMNALEMVQEAQNKQIKLAKGRDRLISLVQQR